MDRDPMTSPAIIAGVRTPFCKHGTDLRGASAADLATHVFREVLDRTGIDPQLIDEVILGCGGPDPREANIARVAALRAGVPTRVPAVTVMRNCASGMEAILAAEHRMRAGDGEVFLVGGAESMSNYPLIMGPQLTSMFGKLATAKTLPQRLGTLLGFRPSFLAPRIAIKEGLTDPVSGLIMGLTAENVAAALDVDRETQDRFALRSHQRAAEARDNGRLAAEITPLAAPPHYAQMVAHDNGVRPEQSMQSLGKLRPFFDRREGDVTVGNSCQVTDGAVALLIASQAKARELGLEPLALIRSQARVGLDPAYMGLGPAHVIPRTLDAAGIELDQVELFEINEAFAAQVLGSMRALASDDYCREHLGRDAAVGEIDPDIVNVNGGAIALGHPIAASGARLALTLATELRRRGGRFGLASLCVGGGQGQAILLEAS